MSKSTEGIYAEIEQDQDGDWVTKFYTDDGERIHNAQTGQPWHTYYWLAWIAAQRELARVRACGVNDNGYVQRIPGKKRIVR